LHFYFKMVSFVHAYMDFRLFATFTVNVLLNK